MLAPDDIAIHRLQVRGDKRTSEQWVRDLSTTHWAQPLPSQLHNAWVLVRELKVKGKSCDLRRETAQRLSSQLQQAQRANHANAASANVIWFASFPELLAFLLVDLARGNPAYWYWSRWSHLLKYSRQEGVARLLCEHVEFLPAVIEQLRNNGNLPLVWKQLSVGTAMTLVRELARCGRVSYPDTWQLEQGGETAEQELMRTYLHTQNSQQVYWRSLLAGVQPDDGRVYLAAIIQGLAVAPQWLQRRPALWIKLWTETTLEARQNIPSSQALSPVSSVTDIHQFAGKPDEEKTRSQLPAGESLELVSELRITNDRFQPGQHQPNDNFTDAPVPVVSASADKEVAEAEDNRPSLPQTPIHSALVSANTEIDSVHNSLRDIPVAHASATDVITIMDDAVQPSQANQNIGDSFSAFMGGFFYLLNPLNHLFANNLAIPATDMSPGIFLWDVYRALVEQFPSLPECMEQSLADFFWYLAYPDLEFNARRQLIKQRESLQPIVQARQCVAQLGTLPGAQALWQSLVQGSAFLQVPARVVTTASHWDIYFPLAHVRLDLRLAGWDINPGWLPWLGRVVTFHYVESMDHGGEAQP